MKRRDLLLLAVGAAAWPSITTALAKLWRIAVVDTATLELNKINLDAFKTRLRELGYVEGQNLLLEYRSADGRNERLPTLVSEVIGFRPDVIVVRGTPEVIAVKKATRTIPVVMSAVADPVGAGVAASLARPGQNITGIASAVTEIETKRVQHLAETVPNLKRMASLGDFRNPVIHLQWEQVQTAANSLGIEPIRLDVGSAADLAHAFETAVREQVQAVRVGIDGTTRPNRYLIIQSKSGQATWPHGPAHAPRPC